MTLAETQALFAAAVTRPGSVPPGAVEACFAGTPALPAAARVAIYAGMYRARLAEALRDTFPLVARLLGEARFQGLAEAYLARHPSRHHDVGRVGRWLPAFLRRRPAQERPDLADLAALEWARQEVFFAPPAATAGGELFAGLDEEAFAAARPVLSPALRRLRVAWDPTPAWRALTAGEPAGEPVPGPVALVAWRRGFEVFHARLEAEEAEALARAAAGRPLAEVLEPFDACADPAEAARAALAGWLGEGMLAGLRRPPPRAP